MKQVLTEISFIQMDLSDVCKYNLLATLEDMEEIYSIDDINHQIVNNDNLFFSYAAIFCAKNSDYINTTINPFYTTTIANELVIKYTLLELNQIQEFISDIIFEYDVFTLDEYREDILDILNFDDELFSFDHSFISPEYPLMNYSQIEKDIVILDIDTFVKKYIVENMKEKCEIPSFNLDTYISKEIFINNIERIEDIFEKITYSKNIYDDIQEFIQEILSYLFNMYYPSDLMNDEFEKKINEIQSSIDYTLVNKLENELEEKIEKIKEIEELV